MSQTTTTPATSTISRKSRKPIPTGYEDTWMLLTPAQKASITKRLTIVDGVDTHFRAAAKAAQTFRLHRPSPVSAAA